MTRDDIMRLPEEALPRLEDLSGDLRLLAEVTGVRLALAAGLVFSDTTIRLHGVRTCIRVLEWKMIRAEYDQGGVTGAQLARKYGMTERTIWKILGETETEKSS